MNGVLIFGDSIVAGRGTIKDKNWVRRLTQDFYKKDKYNTIVYNLGVPGESTTELLERFITECKARARPRDPGDHFAIILSIGINDTKGVSSSDNPKTPINIFRRNIRKLIKLAKGYTDFIIFVGLMPVDENKTTPIDNNYFLNERVKTYNDVIKNVCEEKRVPFVALLDDWPKEDYRKFLSEDGVHPNELGHQKIYKKVVPLLTDHLK